MYPSGRRCGKPCPHLRLTRKEAEKIRGNCFPGRPHGIRAIFLHVQEGRTVDSLGWWARGKGVQASSSVIVDLDGRIVRCVPDDRGPWTNGEVRNPSPRGKALLERHPGVNPNVYSVTLEAEGFSAGEHPEAQLRSIAWMCRAWIGPLTRPLTVTSSAEMSPSMAPSAPTVSRMALTEPRTVPSIFTSA